MVLENLVLFLVVMSADLAAWWIKDKFLVKKPKTKRRRKKKTRRKRRHLAPVVPITGTED
jgi:hypothetical protein